VADPDLESGQGCTNAASWYGSSKFKTQSTWSLSVSVHLLQLKMTQLSTK